MKQTFLGVFLAASALSGAPAALAAIPPAYRAHLPPQHHRGAVDYITGGMTREEADALKRASQDYPLELVFGERDGGAARKLRHVPITITDANDRLVFDGESEGPYFIARLPAGRYKVVTTWGDWTFTRDVTIAPGERDRVLFDWKKVPGQAVVASR